MWMWIKKDVCIHGAFGGKTAWFFPIDRIIYKCRAASQKVGGGGIRYTVLICGKESYLFQEGNKWFVEAKENRN